MRCLHVAPSLHPDSGGPARSIPNLCAALQAAGLEVQLHVVRLDGSPVTVEASKSSFTLLTHAPIVGTRSVPRPVRFPREVLTAVRDVDIVHLHGLWNCASTIVAAICRRAGIPYVVSARGMLHSVAMTHHRRRKAVYLRVVEHRTIGSAAAVHFFTENEAQSSVQLLPVGMTTVTIPNGTSPLLGEGIDASSFHRLHPELRGRKIVLYLGRLHWTKNLELQLEAMRLVLARSPETMWLLIGPDAGSWPGLDRLIREGGLTNRIKWLGPTDHAFCLAALACADVFVLTSHHEAHSVAMNEALALGVPVVLTDTVGFRIAGDAGAAKVVPARAPEVATAIRTILEDRRLAMVMGDRGKDFVREQLAWPAIAEATYRAYAELLGKR